MMRSLSRWTGAACAGIVIAAVASCSDGSGPAGHGPALVVVAGGGLTDTVEAQPIQGLVIQLRDSAGAPVAGSTVRVENLPADPAFPAFIGVAPAAGLFFQSTVTETTNANGEVTIRLGFGMAAGAARLGIVSPRFGIADTVSYTVLPGAPARIVAAPRDTALYVTHTMQARAAVTDRNGNPRSEPVTYTALDANAGITSAGVVTAATVGRSKVLVTGVNGTLKDTLRLSVVPPGTIAAIASSVSAWPDRSIVTMQLDGSNASVIPQSAGENNYLQWMPDGASLLFFRPTFQGHLVTISLTGTVTQVMPASPFGEDNWARAALTGGYIFFRGVRVYPNQGYIWRVLANGTGLDSVPVGGGTWPSPSPDGSRVAYLGVDSHIHVYTYSPAGDLDLGVTGQIPRWSPDGTLIAYTTGSPGTLKLIQPDGQGGRTVAPTLNVDGKLDWMPGSQWIVAPVSGTLNVINVTTGAALPLGFTVGLGDVSCKP